MAGRGNVQGYCPRTVMAGRGNVQGVMSEDGNGREG